MTVKLKNKWIIIPYKNKDLPAIELFFKKNYNGPEPYGTAQMFKWKIINNYAGIGIINLVKDNNKIVSTTSVTPKILFLKGKKNLSAEIGDTFTDPEYQRQGMFALLINKSTKDIIKKGITFIYGVPNNQSLPGYEKKANYKIIPELKVDLYTIPLNIKPIIRKKIPGFTGAFIGIIVSNLLKSYYKIHHSLINLLISNKSHIEELKSLPKNWNDFWIKSYKKYDFILSREKDALNWRFFNNPNKYNFNIIKNKDQIIGYIFYRIISDGVNNSLIISDYLFLPGYEKKLYELLMKILKDVKYTNITIINVWCTQNSPYQKIFKNMGFIKRIKIPIISFQNDCSLHLNNNCSTWHFTISDTDNV